jgi:hypothetical protein
VAGVTCGTTNSLTMPTYRSPRTDAIVLVRLAKRGADVDAWKATASCYGAWAVASSSSIMCFRGMQTRHPTNN